jgi:hypothetical protein
MVVNLKKLLPANRGFGSFTVSAKPVEVSLQKRPIPPTILELGRRFLAEKSGHRRSAASFHAGQQLLNRTDQLVALLAPVGLESQYSIQFVLIRCFQTNLNQVEFK